MGARVRHEADGLFAVCEDALDDAGYVLTTVDAVAAGNVKLVDAAGEKPIGINLMSTNHPVTGVATADVVVTILVNGVAWVQLEPNATRADDIVVGDLLQGSANGQAIFRDDEVDNVNDIDPVIGIALQEVANGVDTPTAGWEPFRAGLIMVQLRPRSM